MFPHLLHCCEHRSPAICTPIQTPVIHMTLISRKRSVHFCAMASSPLGRMRLKGSPPTPVNPWPKLGSRAVSPVLAEEASTLAVDPPGPGRISGSDSLAGGADPGLVAEADIVLAIWGLVGVVGLVRPRLARASRVPSGSTMTLITETETGRESMCRMLCVKVTISGLKYARISWGKGNVRHLCALIRIKITQNLITAGRSFGYSHSNMIKPHPHSPDEFYSNCCLFSDNYFIL